MLRSQIVALWLLSGPNNPQLNLKQERLLDPYGLRSLSCLYAGGVIAVLTPEKMKLAESAVAAAAYVHGVAGSRCAVEGTIARDVVGLISDAVSDVIPHVN